MAAAKIPTVSLKQISADLADKHGKSKKEMAETLDAFLASLTPGYYVITLLSEHGIAGIPIQKI